jgi:hypothetical protein
MSEEIAEIEKAINQASNIIETVISLQQRLQKLEQHKVNVPRAQTNNNQLDHLSRLHAKLSELNTHISNLDQRIGRYRYNDIVKTEEQRAVEQTYRNLRTAVADQALTPHEATQLIRAAVADKTMTPDQAATEILRFAPSELPASRKIMLREAARTAFENGGNVSLITKQFNKAVEPPGMAKENSFNIRNV